MMSTTKRALGKYESATLADLEQGVHLCSHIDTCPARRIGEALTSVSHSFNSFSCTECKEVKAAFTGSG